MYKTGAREVMLSGLMVEADDEAEMLRRIAGAVSDDSGTLANARLKLLEALCRDPRDGRRRFIEIVAVRWYSARSKSASISV